MNQFQFVASIAEREILRYTPAGIPIVSATLLHSSEQIEAGVKRQVEFEIAAIAAGEISGRFSQADLGRTYQFTGFLARKRRNSRSLVFHIAEFLYCGTESSEAVLCPPTNQINIGAKNGIR